eukprot:355667-Chlamydomonas_euryale.AAC.1
MHWHCTEDPPRRLRSVPGFWINPYAVAPASVPSPPLSQPDRLPASRGTRSQHRSVQCGASHARPHLMAPADHSPPPPHTHTHVFA